MLDYNRDLYPKRGKLATIFYWIFMGIMGLMAIAIGYIIVISGIHTIQDIKAFFGCLIIIVYSITGVIYFEDRPQITQLQIKHHKSVQKQAGWLVVLWTIISWIIIFIFIIHDGKIVQEFSG